MKKNILSIVILIGIFLFFVAGCSSAPTPPPTPQPVAASPTPIPESTSTAVPVPTETLSPTATPTPKPIPCNIVFDSNREGKWEIFSMGPDGSNTVNLSNSLEDDFDPSWSPDGKQVAFVSNRVKETDGGQYIYVMNADGSNVHQLSTENWSDMPDWSPEGSLITYTSNDDINVIKADGSGKSVNLTNSPEKDGRSKLSPDGMQIAWVSGFDRNSNIFVMNIDGSNKKQITDDGSASRVEWTIDGRLFAGWGWKDKQRNCNNCVVNADGSNIMDAGGKGQLRRLIPFWTVEGEQVEIASANFNKEPFNEIYLIGEIFPGMFLNLTNNAADDRNPDWPAQCSRPQKVIGYAGDDPAFQQRKENFQRACDQLGINCVYGGMNDLVQKNVTAIILNSVNGLVAEKQQDIQNAVDKGIPVFLLDAEMDLTGVYSVTVDQREWAKIGVEWLFNKMGGKGQFTFFDLYPQYKHGEVIKELLSKYPGITVVEHLNKQENDFGWIKPEADQLVKKNPDLKAIWTNANMEGVIQGVVEESGAPQDKWPFMTCEATGQGLGTWIRTLERNPNFECIAAGNPPGIAYDAVYAAYYLITGAKINESVLGGQYGNSLFVDIPVVTSENLQEWQKNNSSVEQLMKPEEIKQKWFQK